MKGLLMTIDLRRAYDSIKWESIHDLVMAFNFPTHLVRCIMAFITTPKFTVLINGSTKGFFKAQ